MAGCYAVFHKQLGDLLLLEPALARLRDYHGAPVEVLTRQGHGPLLELMDGVQFCGGLPISFCHDLYCFDPLSKSALRSLIAPVLKKTCILPEKREMQWYHRLVFGEVIVPELEDRYVAEYFWANTPVPAREPFRPPCLQRPPEAWKPDGLGDEPFILLNPTSGWRKKSWVSDRWAKVLQHLFREQGVRFIMTSASTDWQVEHCREIVERAGSMVTSLSDRTTLRHFLWLCANARMVLTVDGAAAHLAAAFGVKNLTLFGPTSLSNWHFPAATSVAVQASASEDGIRRMRNIPAEAVVQAARAIA